MPPEQPPHSTLLPEARILPPVASEQLPGELLVYPQWVCWRYGADASGKKLDKQPVNPRTLGNAGVHWPNTWGSFEQALSTYTLYRQRGVAGLGFVLTHDDPFVGVDVDNCLRDDGIAQEAQQIITHLASYSEVSPSGQGLRILVRHEGFERNVRTPGLELYSHSRFLTLTGRHLPATPREIRRISLDELTALLPPSPGPTSSVHPIAGEMTQFHAEVASPALLWERIFAHDRYGEDHRRRFLGDTSLDRGDHSLTVIRLLNCLARWTEGDAVHMREMILLSPLANAKWLSKRGKGDWLDHQIADAIAFVKRGK